MKELSAVSLDTLDFADEKRPVFEPVSKQDVYT
jgi:hypothetical protein